MNEPFKGTDMKAAKWREFSEEELERKTRELTEEIFNLRFQLSMGMAKNPSRLSQARRGSGAGPCGAPREKGRLRWVSGRVVKGWSCRTRCRRRVS